MTALKAVPLTEAEARLVRLTSLLDENSRARTEVEARIVDELVTGLASAELGAYATNIINSDAEKRLLELERRRASLLRAQEELTRHIASLKRAAAIRLESGGA